MVIDNKQLNKWATSKSVDLKQSSDYMEAIQWGLRWLLMIAFTLTSVLIASIFYGLPHPAAHMKAPYYLQTDQKQNFLGPDWNNPADSIRNVFPSHR